MRFRTFNQAGERDCLFVMGWGNRWDHESVRWLIDELADAEYRVHVAELPTRLDDFRADWVEPVAEYARDLEEFALLSHSAGGLVATTIDGADTHVYLSPFWGYSLAYPDWALELVARVPTTMPFIPTRIDDPAIFGEYAGEERLQDTPSWLSPAFVRETRDAQSRLLPANVNLAAIARRSRPPEATVTDETEESADEDRTPRTDLPTPRWSVEDDAVVFCSLSDEVVSLNAIGARVNADNVVLYEGGHELFASTSREQHVPTLLAALEAGDDALE
jgi:alpha-beta hydrolase superfamily lysophospholipase